MTNFEIITTYLKHGINVGVKSSSGQHLTISPAKDEDGGYRTSGGYDTLEKAKQNIGKEYGYSDLEKASKDWTDITPFHLDFEPYPVGMKVKTIYGPRIRTISESDFRKIYRVEDTSTEYSHTELMPYFEEKVIEMTIAQIEEKLNIKGLKIIK